MKITSLFIINKLMDPCQDREARIVQMWSNQVIRQEAMTIII